MKFLHLSKKAIGLTLLALIFSGIQVWGQTLTIQGTVRTSDGETLPGASVIEKGTQNGTVADINGKYSIQAPANGTLVFSFVGFKDLEVPINNQKTIDVTVEPQAQSLEEVVVVGYGTQRKEAVTGSVATVKGDLMREVPAANISNAMQGRVAGVDMQQTSSKPGAAMQIRIRGTRSLTATNDPLIVLDGIPFNGAIGDINPSDIKSLDILKDASATAIYGSRGANGVILVTTNKGVKGQKAKFTYMGYQGMNTVFKEYPMMNNTDFIKLRKAAGVYTNGVDESDDVNTNWQDLYYRTGRVTNHNLGVTGGTDKGSYSFSGGYYKEEAILPGQDFNRFSMRGSLDQELGKFIKVGFTTSNNYSVNQGNNSNLYGNLSMSPIANPYNADGTWKRTIKMPLDEQWNYTQGTIDALGDKWIDQTKAYGSYNNLYGEVKIPGVEGLKYHINLAGNFRMTNGGQYTGEGVFSSNATTVSTATVSNSLTTNWAVENLLTYDRTFDKHQLNIVGLYSAEQTQYNSSQVSAKDIPADAFQFYNLGRAAGEFTINPDYQSYKLSGLMSWMGRAMYSYDNRYMLSATIRSDASSRLAEGHKWHTYPAVSAGWNIANEAFMDNVSVIDALKLRVGYGQTSNQSVEPYATLGLLNTRPYNFGTGYSTGYYVSALPNPELGWEFSKTMNYGLDFAILKNRLTGTFEYYLTNTENVLLSVGLPPTSGVTSITQNVGSTQNKGWELSLNGVILENANGLTWEAGVNFYSNHNEIVSLASGQVKDEANFWFVGHPISVVYDYNRIGLWQAEDANLLKFEPGGNVGMIKVEYKGAFNDDGTPKRQIGPDDREIIDLEPKFQGGFNTRLAYKGFDLGIVAAFQSGGILISTLYSSQGYLNMMTGRRGNVQVDYWTTENTGAKYPKPGGILSGDNPKYASTLGYFDASYVKIRSFTLGYNFDQKGIKNAGFEKLRLYFTAQNPFVLFSPYHKETGMDPETNSYGNENAAVAYTENLKRLLTIGTNTPSIRKYLVGIEFTF